jgi:dCMP deaminase
MLTWSEYFMGFAEHAAKKSKDTTQVGAVLVGPDNEVRLTAYNGPPRGVLDLSRRRERPTKYLFASHAEANLVAFAAREGIRTTGCTVYVTHAPCAACARTLIQAGVRAIVCGPGTTSMPAEEFDAADQMLFEARVLRTAFAKDEEAAGAKTAAPDRYCYEPGARVASQIHKYECAEVGYSDVVECELPGYLIFDRKRGLTESLAVAFCDDRADAERIVATLNKSARP